MTTAATTSTTTDRPAGRANRIRQAVTGPRGLGTLAWLLAAAGLGLAIWTARSWSWWSTTWLWLGRWWMVPTAVLLLAAAATLGVLRARHPAAPPRPMPEPGTEVVSALTPRAILLGALILLGLGATSAVLLLVNFSGTEPRDRLDAIRTAATLLVGTGGAAALLLAARRQRAAELTLAVQRRNADATEHDAAARRITELYLKAVEQLGSDKAAVRHGGLYALERVAQDNPDQRQTVINVICAYLRSPYTPPPGRPAARQTGLPAAARRGSAGRRVAAGLSAARRTHLTPPAPTAGSEQSRQEREVRLTAQRILTSHLCADLGKTTDQPTNPRYWAEAYDLDLTGAILIDFHATGLTVQQATFTKAQFIGRAGFNRATFTAGAGFDEATFAGYAWFDEATFVADAWFNGATFAADAWFDEATFVADAWFNGATFAADVQFRKAAFAGGAGFDGATFTRDAGFNKAIFTRGAGFAEATFTGDAWFIGATFAADAWFIGATFSGNVQFGEATFTRHAQFGTATVTASALFSEATLGGVPVRRGALSAAATVQSRVWPEGWTVDENSEHAAVPGEGPIMLRLVPIPPVLTGPTSGDGSQGGRGGSSPV